MEVLIGLGVGATLFLTVTGFCVGIGKLEDWVSSYGKKA